LPRIIESLVTSRAGISRPVNSLGMSHLLEEMLLVDQGQG